ESSSTPVAEVTPKSASPQPAPPAPENGAPAIKDLAGLKPADVLSILGKPDLKRDEPPAELWQYRAADCVLNLFFYREAGVYRLLSAESWTRASAASAAPVPCRAAGAPVDFHTAL